MKLTYSIREIDEMETELCPNEYSYWLILSGNGHFSSNNESFLLSSHDVLEIPPNQNYHFSCTEKIQIGIITLSDFESPNTYLQKKSYNDTELIRKVFFFALEFQGFHHNSISGLMYHVNKLMYETLSKTGLKDYRINSRIAAAIEELNKHYREPNYNFNTVIAASGYSPGHFHKLFRETTGTSPIGYIHSKRIEHAKYLLRQEESPPIKEIAHECGYQDVYYFSRMFRKQTGISPSKYAQ